MVDLLTEILKELGCVKKFNTIVYSMIKPFVRSKTLEVGSGIGRFSNMLVKDFESVDLSDSEKNYVEFLKTTFPKNKVHTLDIGKKSDYEGLSKFDTIICLNVLEHVRDDLLALREMKKIAKENGKLLLIVPVHKWLFNSLDESVLHFRRYSESELVKKAISVGWAVERIHHFNLVGIFGWFVSGLFRSRVFNPRLVKLFDFLFPSSRFIETKVLKESIGLCMFAVLRNLSH